MLFTGHSTGLHSSATLRWKKKMRDCQDNAFFSLKHWACCRSTRRVPRWEDRIVEYEPRRVKAVNY